MKKMLSLVLAAASMSFALTVIGNQDNQTSSDGGVFAPQFRFSTGRSLGVDGFKVYVYFSNDKANEMPVLIKEAHAYAQAAKKIELQKVSSHVYRVMMDFSNTSIPANSVFPPSPTVFFRAMITDASATTHALRPYIWGKNFRNIVVESLDGEILDGGPHPNLHSRVGVLAKNASTCKSGGLYFNTTIPLPDVIFAIESEKDDCASRITGPTPHGISVSGNSVSFRYCIFEYDELPRVSYDYAVLRLDDQCPVGSYPFRRTHDTEDSWGQNFVYGPVWPNSVGDNAEFEYCFVPKDPTSTKVYPFDMTYSNDYNTSVFANVNKTGLAQSTLYVDDEDSGKSSDSWYYYGLSTKKANEKAIIDRIHNIMNGSDNTTYHIVTRVKPNVAKSAEVADNSVSSAYVAAAPAAPAIKGLSRTAVAVELKSAGNVKVSIVNVSGAVVASIAQENLQAGAHQLQWDAAMVPSGRYVVKIEQNGMVNAKNVILK